MVGVCLGKILMNFSIEHAPGEAEGVNMGGGWPFCKPNGSPGCWSTSMASDLVLPAALG